MSDAASLEQRGKIALIKLNNPPVNALGFALRSGLVDCLKQAASDPEIEALVLIGEGRCFCGGADIREFDQAPKEPSLAAIIAGLEESPKPIVAAIHGLAFGGGLELALGCHYRVATPGSQLGQPEVKLGIIPGAGGTQRLPRLIGLGPALDAIVGGDPMTAEEGRALGLLDAVVEGDLAEGACSFAVDCLSQGEPWPRARDKQVEAEDAEALFAAKRQAIARKARGFLAPFACIDSVANAVTMDFDAGLKREREIFVECRESEQSKGQRHAFFAERQAAKVPDVPADTNTVTIQTAGVVGCGTMGGGIAMNFANAGIPVTVVEADEAALERGLAAIRRTYEGSVKRGRISEKVMAERLGCIQGASELASLAEADIIIEAVFEDLDLKREVFAALDRVAKPGAILATNTSTLDINQIAAATRRPEAVIGTHFFSPANVMRLMENVRGEATSKETIAGVMRLAKRIGKVGVLVGVCDGFVGNRMLHAYGRQANFLLEEGALPQQVDKVLYEFGMPMGPFAMGDLAGLDVGWRIRQQRAKAQPEVQAGKQRYSPIADRICEGGRFGQKTGAGWYRYEAGSRTPRPDPEIEALILGVSEELGFTRRPISDAEILERCMYPLVNEGAKILEEGLALRASDIDIIWIYGYGFPIWRGGPMFWADRVGLAKVHDAMCRLYEEHGELLRPAALLADLAKSGRGFGR